MQRPYCLNPTIFKSSYGKKRPGDPQGKSFLASKIDILKSHDGDSFNLSHMVKHPHNSHKRILILIVISARLHALGKKTKDLVYSILAGLWTDSLTLFLVALRLYRLSQPFGVIATFNCYWLACGRADNFTPLG